MPMAINTAPKIAFGSNVQDATAKPTQIPSGMLCSITPIPNIFVFILFFVPPFSCAASKVINKTPAKAKHTGKTMYEATPN